MKRFMREIEALQNNESGEGSDKYQRMQCNELSEYLEYTISGF